MLVCLCACVLVRGSRGSLHGPVVWDPLLTRAVDDGACEHTQHVQVQNDTFGGSLTFECACVRLGERGAEEIDRERKR